MSEKPPQFERPPIPVFGKVPEEAKTKVAEEISRRFSSGEIADITEEQKKKISALEYAKTPFEHTVITEADSLINSLREKYGLETFNVPKGNIHILPPELYREISGNADSKGVHEAFRQLVLINAGQVKKKFTSEAQTLLHELFHLKGFVSFDAKSDKKFKQRRVGLMVHEGYSKLAKDEFYSSFEGLNEAVVQEMTQRNVREILEKSSDPEVKKELEWLDSDEATELKKKILKNAVPEQDEVESLGEIQWIENDGKYAVNTYRTHTRLLRYLAKEIGSDQDKDPEEIIDLFFKAHFTGNLLEIARIVENCFGDGSFRDLSMMTRDIESGRQMLDSLKKKRLRIKKDQER